MSRGDLVNRAGLESSGGLLSRGDLATVAGPWSACGLWSTDDLGKYGVPAEEGAPGSVDVQQTAAARLRGFSLRMATYYWMTWCNPAVGPCLGIVHGPGTWPSGLDGASAFAATVVEKTVIGEGPGRLRTAGACSDAAAAVALCAAE